MKEGEKFHNTRTVKHYQSEKDNETIYNAHLKDSENNISTVVDMLRIRDNEIIVVELKRFSPYHALPPKSHILQATFSSIIAEKVYKKPAHIIEMRYWRGVNIEIPLTEKLREQVKFIISEIKTMIAQGILPHPTPDVKKCESCEYWRICLRA